MVIQIDIKSDEKRLVLQELKLSRAKLELAIKSCSTKNIDAEHILKLENKVNAIDKLIKQLT